MAYIDTTAPEDATGPLRREYDAAERRAGRVWEILTVQSNNPPAMRDGLRLYRTVMFGESPLTRAQREMIAVVTSTVNDCHY